MLYNKICLCFLASGVSNDLDVWEEKTFQVQTSRKRESLGKIKVEGLRKIKVEDLGKIKKEQRTLLFDNNSKMLFLNFSITVVGTH